MLALSLEHGRELEVTRQRCRPVEVFRVAMFHGYASDRMQEGGFVCTRAELALLLMALDRTTPAAEAV
jgi:hypothetical protein